MQLRLFIALNDDRLPLGGVPELLVNRVREPRWPRAHLLDRQTGEQASPRHELPVNEKLLPLTHESNVFPLKMTCGSPPNVGLKLRRAISIQAAHQRLLEKHAIARSAARVYCKAAGFATRTLRRSVCWTSPSAKRDYWEGMGSAIRDCTILSVSSPIPPPFITRTLPARSIKAYAGSPKIP